jgi:hypothetical protein
MKKMRNSYYLQIIFKVKSKVVPVYTIKGYRQSGGRVPLILSFGTRWR